MSSQLLLIVLHRPLRFLLSSHLSPFHFPHHPWVFRVDAYTSKEGIGSPSLKKELNRQQKKQLITNELTGHASHRDYRVAKFFLLSTLFALGSGRASHTRVCESFLFYLKDSGTLEVFSCTEAKNNLPVRTCATRVALPFFDMASPQFGRSWLTAIISLHALKIGAFLIALPASRWCFPYMSSRHWVNMSTNSG